MLPRKVLDALFPRRSFKDRRSAFLQERKSLYLGNDEFVRGVFASPSDTEIKLSVILRRLIGREGHIAPEKLHHCERIVEIEPIICCPSDWRERAFVLQDELRALSGQSINIDMLRMKVLLSFPRGPTGENPPSRTFGAWILEATTELSDELQRLHLSI